MAPRSALVAAAMAGAAALNNGAKIPQMGYNSWYDIGMGPSDALVRETAAAMQSNGLFAAGYELVALDDGWSVGRDANGAITVDPKFFPNGIAALASWLHSQGMKFGLYGDRGPTTCGGRIGQQGHQTIDANTFVAWGVDYFKEDSCNAPQDQITAYAEYATMRDALLNASAAAGVANITFSLCGWESWYAPVGRSLGNSWRIGPDDTNWPGVLSDIDDMAPLWPYAGEGGVNDPCLLLGADANGNDAVTEQQSRAQFSMWAVLMAPLLLSQNVRNMTAFRLATYTNEEVIAINQDGLHRQGMRLYGGPLSYTSRFTRLGANIPITVQTCGTGVSSQQWVFNVTGPEYLSNPASGQCANLDDCNTDVIAFDCVTTGGTCCGADCYQNLQFSLDSSDGTLRTPLLPGQCLANGGVGVQASFQACTGTANQQWAYSSTAQTISNAGSCLTVGGSTGPLVNVWGRPLMDGGWALVFLNVDTQPYNITCDYATCLSATGMNPGLTVSVRDVWNHVNLPTQTLSAGFTATQVPADGGVVMLRITPLYNSTAVAGSSGKAAGARPYPGRGRINVNARA